MGGIAGHLERAGDPAAQPPPSPTVTVGGRATCVAPPSPPPSRGSGLGRAVNCRRERAAGWRRGRDSGSTVMPQATASHSLHPSTSAPADRGAARVAPPAQPPRDRTRPTHTPPTHPPARLLTRPLRHLREGPETPVDCRPGGRRDGGEGGIRTRGTVTRTHAFQACSFGHSDTSPHGPWKPLTSTSQRTGGSRPRVSAGRHRIDIIASGEVVTVASSPVPCSPSPGRGWETGGEGGI